MSLKNSCPNESRCRLWLTRSWSKSCSRGKSITFWTTSGCKFHKALWRHTQRSGSTCFDSSMLCELRPNYPQASKDRLQALAAPSVCKGPYACAWQTQGRCCPHNVCIVDRRGSALRSSPNDNGLGWNSTQPPSAADEVSLQPPALRLAGVRGQSRNRESRQECLPGGQPRWFEDPWPWIYQGRAFVQLVMPAPVERLRGCLCRSQGCWGRFRNPQLVLLSPVPSCDGTL